MATLRNIRLHCTHGNLTSGTTGSTSDWNAILRLQPPAHKRRVILACVDTN